MTASPTCALIGGGPAGLMAAEVLAGQGVAVSLYERMPSLGRRFLMAGRGGLNLTHSETFETFLTRYGAARERLQPLIEAFPPQALIAWTRGLGQETFVGSSGRVFPAALKASPLLRAWIGRLQDLGVQVHMRHRWTGWTPDGALRFTTPDSEVVVAADATILALGGASWPRLGSDGGWGEPLAAIGVEVSALKPANVGFDVAWSDLFRERFAGEPLKNIALAFGGQTVRGEAMITARGLEGGAIYALSAALRDAVQANGSAIVEFDLRPEMSVGSVTSRVADYRGGQSMANHLRKTLRMSPLEVNLLREAYGVQLPTSPGTLARAIKSVPVNLTGVQPLARAISTAGGVALDAVDADLMLKARPGVFVAGEMLDWEAPTGGYLLQASFATGVAAANGVLKRLRT